MNRSEGFHTYYIYIITNKYRTAFYIGVTNNLKLRLFQHKENVEARNKTYASNSKYNIEFLVYYEKFTWIHDAISREKELKKWRKDKKMALIKDFNPSFEFLDYQFG